MFLSSLLKIGRYVTDQNLIFTFILDGSKLTFEQAAAQAFVFFVAGFETSSTTIQFILYELAKNPDIQKRARHEIDEVLRKNDGIVSYESISAMEYLGWVINGKSSMTLFSH